MQRPPTLPALVCAAALVLTACAGEDKDSKAPTTPSGVTAQASSATSVHVMWENSSDDKAVTGYEVFEGEKRVKELPAAKNMVDINRLTPKTAYSFTVRARDAAGNLSKPSPAIAVTTPEPTPEDKQPPTSPRKLTGALDGKTQVRLDWQAASDNTKVTSYDIYQEDSRIHSVPGTETKALVPGLRPGTVYSFTVRARDAGENSSPDSNPVDLTTAAAPGKGANTAPTDLKFTVRKGVVDLSWMPPKADGPIETHELHINGKLATTIVWGVIPEGKTVTHEMVVPDPPGTRLSIKLRAKLPDGKWGDFSAQRTVIVR
ncbi:MULTISPECIES: fibronectin type III domain-containing protein [unclassified Streptomyces]|uniref:fibronectin type III domain-containing protein n=1 Tax=unclassified Streptomyces TaxID=2593676 RepID=UPI002E2911E3|nr:fibronectin type III domain-containing protein [Streptomyces sp. NBC_00690]